jgi:hypothetical protein
MYRHLTIRTAAAMLVASSGAQASEAGFLASLAGSWSGKGTVMVRTDSSPIHVTCKFNSSATANSLSLDGKCTALVLFARSINADLIARGAKYEGSYVGAGTGPAILTGSRLGNVISFGIEWAKNVNGDRAARMNVEKIGPDGMRLTTIDVDPKTGRSVVTSRIDLHRL